MRRPLLSVLVLALVAVGWTLAALGGEVETSAPVVVTPAAAFTHYNTTGITIANYLYLYHQGGGDITETTCPDSTDKIIAYRAPITNGVPGTFQRVGRISPCVKSPTQSGQPVWPGASYGPGQIFQATINGVTKYHLLADVSDTITFRNVWRAESTDGINWTWYISGSQNTSKLESNIRESGDAVAHTIDSIWASQSFMSSTSFFLLNPILLSTAPATNNATWWGFFNYWNGSSQVGAMKISWSTGSPVVQMVTSASPSWVYTTFAGGSLNQTPASLAAGNVKTLLFDAPSGQHQLWGSVAAGSCGVDVNCNVNNSVQCLIPGGCPAGDGTVVPQGTVSRPFWRNTEPDGDTGSCSGAGSTFSWWNVTQTSLGAQNLLRSQFRFFPSGYPESRLFPFRWNSPTGNRYLFSATNDNNMCNEFLFSTFYKVYVVRTSLTSFSCTPTSTTLCLQNGRFKVQLALNGSAAPATSYSALAGFFTQSAGSSNLEVGVKILDGTGVNGKFWVFHGAATTLPYTLTITDTALGVVKTYSKQSGSMCGGADTGAFSRSTSVESMADSRADEYATDLAVARASRAACVPGTNSLCLQGDRFQVQVKRNGVAQNGVEVTSETGSFWFFGADTPEVFVKVLDGRSVNNKFWVFYGSLTDQTFQVVVTDSTSGVAKTYNSGAAFCGFSDTAAF